ncbi:hypothetical protein PPL_03345 [Heterostelium album PN500]|uniref:Uncharacterized protein n=1 Tax=Heterostelium pallidum (strain ATCC 26659 / Pp 5 / PN500) TaxID=670386 RepID=D3B4M0_HETP5|nr:hypothetical protein PPL_03345 [Heterostelium album PN500]EFA84268.1 hypothetical protein PPL_03345 [Heterostelium album PN500]|eukprot:XP_020436384.1 hypothetical protein PPL_03345 [Heterostelium album PN500]
MPEGYINQLCSSSKPSIPNDINVQYKYSKTLLS